MREYKFRVYDPNQKKLVYFDLHNITVADNLLCQHDHPVQQYTGMKDKYGKKFMKATLFVEYLILAPQVSKKKYCL